MSAAQLSKDKARELFFRAKRLDIGTFLNIGVIRDHAKRKAVAHFEPQRWAPRSMP